MAALQLPQPCPASTWRRGSHRHQEPAEAVGWPNRGEIDPAERRPDSASMSRTSPVVRSVWREGHRVGDRTPAISGCSGGPMGRAG